MHARMVNLLFLWLYFKSLSVGVYNGNTDRLITRATLAATTTINIQAPFFLEMTGPTNENRVNMAGILMTFEH